MVLAIFQIIESLLRLISSQAVQWGIRLGHRTSKLVCAAVERLVQGTYTPLKLLFFPHSHNI